MISVKLPFAGFYSSYHDEAFDMALERMFDPEGSGAAFASHLSARFSDTINWQAAQTRYAKTYAETFADAIGAKRFQFEEMTSPREYNFTTDRIFGKFSERFLLSLLRDKEIRAELDTVARDWFTSRSGFFSSYPSTVAEWGKRETWDHNQWGALVQAAANIKLGDHGVFGQAQEFALMEDCDGNGDLDNWMWSNTTDNAAMGNRCDKVARYLADRESRA